MGDLLQAGDRDAKDHRQKEKQHRYLAARGEESEFFSNLSRTNREWGVMPVKGSQDESGCSLQKGTRKTQEEQEVKDSLLSQRWKLKSLGCNTKHCVNQKLGRPHHKSSSMEPRSCDDSLLLCRAFQRQGAGHSDSQWHLTGQWIILLTWQWVLNTGYSHRDRSVQNRFSSLQRQLKRDFTEDSNLHWTCFSCA